MRDRLRRGGPLLGFVALCYLPLLATSSGQVVADTKSYLYLDPDRLLARAWSMWDPHVGLGTVTHQNIGFLWPMGPWYWVMEHLGVPDWIAQRLWLGTILCAAGLGVRYLLRTFGWRGPAIAVAMCAYALTPYVLTIAVRISAILLPFAALPWLLALTVRALRHGGWRHPAAFALVVTTVGTSNATSILLAGIGPALWALWATATRSVGIRPAAAAVIRIGALTLAVNAWWVVGLSVQATNGIEVLRYTESVETTAAASSAQEVLRGLGYWFFYGDDALGPWVGPSRPFQTSLWLLVATFAVPVLALTGGALARWKERAFFVLLAVVGLALAVGVYPYADPPPFGRALRSFLHSDVGMAMRSMPRAAPLVVLALAVLLGAGVRALAERVPAASLPASVAVIGLVVLALPPLWQRTLAPENLRRPEDIPERWIEVGRFLDATDDGTRVLEVPGADFTSYRWGTTVDPVTPGVTDRPMVARELVPMGGAAGWDLLKAFDGRLQANVAEASTVAPVARVLRAGQVLVRSDLRFEHYDTPRPRVLWHLLQGAHGLGPPTPFGRPQPNRAEAPAPMLDELALTVDERLADPPPVAVLPVEASVPIVTAKPVSTPVVLAGSGDGVVDAAAAGLLEGRELLRYSASLTRRDLDEALADGAVLIVTDSNRRRAERWGTVRFTNGFTEVAGHEPLAVDRTDARLPVFPDASDDTRTVAVHRGVTATATSYGGRNEYLPEERAANAVDGDPRTAWRTAWDLPIEGERLRLELDEPATTSTLTFLGPAPPVNRWITRAALRFDGGEPIEVELDERSRTGPGQTVEVGERTFTTLEVEVLEDTVGPRQRYGGLTSTGFAEIRIGDRRLDEAVRLPVDLLARTAEADVGHPLAVVVTRLRSAVTDAERQDEEPTLVRLVELPSARSFTLSGTARLAPRADGALLDRLLSGGGDVDPMVTASSRLAGPDTRPSAALDGDPDTAWSTAFGEQVGQWIEATAGAPRAIESVRLQVLADGRHSVPTRLGIEVDGRRVHTADLARLEDGTQPGATEVVDLPLPPGTNGSTVRVVIEAVRGVETPEWRTRARRTMPIGIAELGLPGFERSRPTGAFSTGCRSDLLAVDGHPVAIEATGTVEDAVAGAPLFIRACEGPLSLGAGTHELRGADGRSTGIDVDRLVLRSAAGGGPSTSGGPIIADAVAAPPPPPTARVRDDAPDRVTVELAGAAPGQPFWLTFGQSWNTGWEATLDGRSLGRPHLVDGFANGWRIEPSSDELVVSLRFAPQRRVDVALRGSLVAALACLTLAVWPRRQRLPAATARSGQAPCGSVTPAPLGWGATPLSVRSTAIAVVGMGTLGWLLVAPTVGAIVGALTLVAATASLPRWVTALAGPVVLAASAAYVVITVARHDLVPGLEWPSELHRAHPLAWCGVLLLAADALVVALRQRARR